MFSELQTVFSQKADPQQAEMLSRYMRDQFKFYGLHTPDRRACYQNFLKQEKIKKQIDWDLLDRAWNDVYREFQYFACDYLIKMQSCLTYEDLLHIKQFAITKPWWDTIDSLIKPIGYLGMHDKRVNKLMLEWSQDPNFWLRRIAIEHQLLRKDQMNTEII